ncbi:MAG: sn-glycerol-3-phosphate import ATP-binding protein UgpC [Candidatus Moanabacter tarae]|uniref:sn-glycerol-3-phosphate import ATP-binding protein UgpC n=1 Tax=Candidatus Moanibacter tarae TaxID=2200854 RepID=A0A2Z4AHX9_9BACT|nr:MAG: sn-glycerol-3-phosphate import ATP-binding protein UgpC [Candidatus Moanabacter tarae]|tara:strand:- start:25379 stop:26500 length:1122 start_codon:yes stop_codon:yes gene_type:complete
MAKVILNNLTKDYTDGKTGIVRAVNQVSLEIKDQEFMVLVGPSGCGKSTTLRMIAGLEEISGGSITIGNHVVNEVPPKDRQIAMVFQNYALYPHMSVYDNMAFGLKIMKYPKSQIRERVLEAAGILGIGDLLERKPNALSGGQRQRVAVGRAIVRKPKVFLFDEPLSNLDAKMRVSMRAEISKLHSRLNSTMIYVTHDQVEAMTMGDRITVMKDGDIMQVAEPLTLYNKPANIFVAEFIGSPPMNFLNGKVNRETNQLRFTENGESPVSFVLSPKLEDKIKNHIDREIILGIRPENLFDAESAPDLDPSRLISAEIEVSEPMGAETYLYLRTGSHSLVARVESNIRYTIGQKISMSIDQDFVHLFDLDTELAL